MGFHARAFVAAAHLKQYSVFELASPASQFLEEFIQAVHQGEHVSALSLWQGMNEFAGEGAFLPTTAPLTTRVRELNPVSDLARVSARLPAEYDHPQWVS